MGCADEQTSSKWASKLVKPTGGRCSGRVHSKAKDKELIVETLRAVCDTSGTSVGRVYSIFIRAKRVSNATFKKKNL